MFLQQPYLPEGKSDSANSMKSASTVTSRTTLSQRFKKAVRQGDLELAQRIARKAFDLQMHRRPSAYKALEPAGLTSPHPPKAALRAARAQRPSSTHPFDVRNIEPVCDTSNPSRQHHRKYSLAIPELSSLDVGVCSESSLILAIKARTDIEMIQWLLDMGHELKGPSADMEGNTALHLAAYYDRPDIIQVYTTSSAQIVSSFADLLDAKTLHERRTALHVACIKGHEDVARQLIDHGAGMDEQDRGGNTALHFAAAWGHLPLVHLLIDRGCVFAQQNNDGSTAADYAFSHSIKAALEFYGRARFEKRKNLRRPVMAASGAPKTYGGGSTADTLPTFDEEFADKGPRRKSYAPPLGRTSVVDIPDRDSDPRTALYGDWTPEKTFAQPGQNLLPGTRGTPSSPAVRQGGSGSVQWSLPSVDVFGENRHPSPRSVTNLPPLSDQDDAERRLVAPLARTPDPSQAWPTSSLETVTPRSGLLPHSQTSERDHSLPNFSAVRRTPSPALISLPSKNEAGSSADKLRMQDAAAMSLFRSATPQPGTVPGRIDTPPLSMPLRTDSPFSLSGRSLRTERSPRSQPVILPDNASPEVPSKD